MQQSEPNFLKNLHTELSDGKAWLGRGIVMAYAALGAAARGAGAGAGAPPP